MNAEQQLQAIRERWRKVSEFPGNHNEYPLANHNSLGEGVTVFVTPKYVGVTEHIRKMPDDIATLLHMVEERDAIIHDLQLDGSALARRAVEEFAAGLWDWVNAERQRHQMTNDFDTGAACALGVVQARIDELRAAGTAPDPLPPDQVRQECERLRQQIDELLSGCGSHSCKVQRPHGQGVNGPCRCVEKLRAARGEEYTP